MGCFAKWRFTRKKTSDRDNRDGVLHSPTAELHAPSPAKSSSNMTSPEQPSCVAEMPSEQVKPASVTSNTGSVPGLAESPSLAVITAQPPEQSWQTMSAPAVTSNSTLVSGSTEEPPEQANSALFTLNTLISPSNDRDLWASAYELLQNQEPELMEDYRKHLGSVQHDKPADAIFLNPQSVQLVVELLLKDREKKQWRFSFLGKDVKMREQIEKLTKFLLWADPIVKSAVSTQPYAALAWAGVSLLLPVG
ncbi:uncharacterized protein N7529_000992 [Penicillium soppii]|uniref:uncharacterized protein n=1 Tax=Penicillium soppii TaxID=69789 RepID=UPI00254975A2|nr:uncharacterized protein N7529_000992 [Penicillium soppii]KAJ5882320.1 hypothetical protein N7529_000992 [Penicillium soppii]